MSCIDVWTIVGSLAGVISVIITIVFAIRAEHVNQIQNNCLEDEHKYNIDKECNEFLYKNNEDINLLALAFTRLKYNPENISKRLLYNNLILQALPVQEKLATKYGLTDLFNEKENFYDKCLKQAKKLFKKFGAESDSKTMLHDYDKYWRRAIESYANEPLSEDYNKIQDLITEVLSNRYMTYEEHVNSPMIFAFNKKSYYEKNYCILDSELAFAKKKPIEYLMRKLNVRNCDERRCCEIICIIIRWIAEYSIVNDKHKQIEIGEFVEETSCYELYLPDFGNGTTATMEDLFLLSLYQVYKSINQGLK